jgi:PIN domain nuclease of toxin-antitoxin system
MPKAEEGRPPGTLLLDTHVWIWMMEGVKSELSSATISLIEEAAGRSELALSAISVWELAMLEAKGRITISRSIDEWVRAALGVTGLRLVDLSPEIAMESTRLPEDPHGDPSDRMIIATARVIGATLVTCDQQILAYGAQGHLRVRNGRDRT